MTPGVERLTDDIAEKAAEIAMLHETVALLKHEVERSSSRYNEVFDILTDKQREKLGI